jgi:hypothetical protein
VLAEPTTAGAHTHAEGRPSDADVAWREATSSLS